MTLADKLARLETMSPAQLRAAWQAEWRRPAPPIGPDLMRRGLAWKLQERVHGGLPVATRKAIAQALARLERTGEVGSPRNLSLKTGTRLVRQWNSKTYHVLVLDNGFEHEGRRYASLTQIAKAITGTQWSGPRFFGLMGQSRAAANG